MCVCVYVCIYIYIYIYIYIIEVRAQARLAASASGPEASDKVRKTQLIYTSTKRRPTNSKRCPTKFKGVRFKKASDKIQKHKLAADKWDQH